MSYKSDAAVIELTDRDVADTQLVVKYHSTSSPKAGTRDTALTISKTKLSFPEVLFSLLSTSSEIRHTRAETITSSTATQELLATLSRIHKTHMRRSRSSLTFETEGLRCCHICLHEREENGSPMGRLGIYGGKV